MKKKKDLDKVWDMFLFLSVFFSLYSIRSMSTGEWFKGSIFNDATINTL